MKPLALLLGGPAAAALIAGSAWLAGTAPGDGALEWLPRVGAAAGAAQSALRAPDTSESARRPVPAPPEPDESEPTPAIGVGSGGAGASFSRRFRGARRSRVQATAGGPAAVQQNAARAAARGARGGGSPDPFTVLVAAQRPDGRWAVEDLASTPPHEPPCPCSAPEHSLDDAGLTSLVVLALLEQGSTTRTGPHREAVAAAAHWLMNDQQDAESGLIGERARDGWLYDHALATSTLGELLQAAWNPLTKRHYTEALLALERARIPGSAWGSRTGTEGIEDVFVTAWAVTALGLAPSVYPGEWIELDRSYRQDVPHWLDSITAAHSGEIPGTHRVEVRSATAAGLWTRIQLGRTAETDPLVARGLDSLLERRLMFHEDPLGCELRGPLLGMLAAYCAGDGRKWSRWQSKQRVMLVDPMRAPPEDARALTATVLCASVHYRYLRVLVR